MPIRPFPTPLNIGIDICKISRIQSIIAAANDTNVNKRKLAAFLRRIFNENEKSAFFQRSRPFVPYLLAQTLAGRWAAKEAIIKASRRSISMKDIFTLQLLDGSLMAVILDEPFLLHPRSIIDREPNPIVHRIWSGSASDRYTPDNEASSKRTLIQSLHGAEAKVTVSHDGDYAIAMAMVPDDLRFETSRPISVPHVLSPKETRAI
jgi:holo-[acyl-carrier protein] synthase